MALEVKPTRGMLLTAALLLAAGCDQKPAPPPAPQATTAPALPTIKKPATGPAYVETETAPSGNDEEARLLKELGQPEARQGQTLTLRRNGIVVLTKVDDADGYALLSNVIKVPTVNGVLTVYQLDVTATEESAENDPPYREYYDERGSFIESHDGFGEWRGAVLAIAREEETFSVGDDGRVSTQLLDWSSKPHRKFDFKARCQATEWVSDTEIKGECTRPADPNINPGLENHGHGEVTPAVFTRVGPNAWRLRELRAPKSKLINFPDNPTTAYDETVEGVPYSGNQ